MKILFFLILIAVQYVVLTCTTAIISGNATPDGRPLLWKNRDSLSIQNAVGWFEGEKYSFVGVINSRDPEGKEIWMGVNTAGFAIMNSHSYNIPVDNNIWRGKLDQEGFLMRAALEICATLEDFEEFLHNSLGEWGITANFGVIDAHGGAAIYECSPDTIFKIDANDPAHAPLGFIIRTNFSSSEDHEKGLAFTRYQRANDLFTQEYLLDNLTPQFILSQASRDLVNPVLNKHVLSGTGRFAPLFDTIARHITVSSMVVHGVEAGSDPAGSTAWIIPGFPLTIPSVPVFALEKDTLPSYLKIEDGADNCLLNAIALERKEKLLPFNYRTDVNYVERVKTRQTLHHILEEEQSIFALYSARRNDMEENFDYEAFYAEIENIIDLSGDLPYVKKQNCGVQQ